MGFSQNFFLRVRKQGLPKITLRIIINREKRDISTGFSCLPENWDPKQNRLKKGSPDFDLGNLALAQLKNKVQSVFLELQKMEDPELKDFDCLMEDGRISNDDFFQWAEHQLEKMKPMVSYNHLCHYKVVVSKLQAFCPDFRFKDFDPDFLESFRNYLVRDLKNHINTLDSNMRLLKRLTTKAIQQGKIKDDPFRYYRSKRLPTNRTFLTPEEIKQIESLFWNSEFSGGVENVARNFLFCCFTGIRYGDLADLKWAEIKSDMITMQMNKTKDFVRIPLIGRAAKLLPDRTGEMVFRVPSNQVTNRLLKSLASQSGIEKELTSHVARHTFATLGITLGIPIEVISKILGHHDLKTTQIYAKIVDQVKAREMMKMENF